MLPILAFERWSKGRLARLGMVVVVVKEHGELSAH
jgi:hypothetical protein